MQVTKFVIPEIIFGVGALDQVGTSLVRMGSRFGVARAVGAAVTGPTGAISR